MSGIKKRLAVTEAQTWYLIELIEDDLADTDLTISEQQQARSLLRKLKTLLAEEFGSDTDV